MLGTFFKRFAWFWILVLVQALILNNIHFFGYATPVLYVYWLLKFSVDTSRYSLILWGFCIGLAVDIFSNTPGVNAAATTFLAFIRPNLLYLFSPRDSADDFSPSIQSMGTKLFMRYCTIALLLHQIAFILILTFSFANPLSMLIKVVSSTFLTLACISCIEFTKK